MTDLSHSREKDKNQSGGVLHFRRTDFVVFPDNDPVSRLLGPVDWPHAGLGFLKPSVGTICWRQRSILSLWSVIACSRFGSVKLGPEQSKPEFSLLSWAAMLFAAGIGIDLMFFSVAEPVTQYMQPPEGAGQTIEARVRRWSGRCFTTA